MRYRRFVPRRVWLVVGVMVVGVVTNSLYKNVVSGLAASICAIALSFWVAQWLSSKPQDQPKDEQ